MSDLQKQFLKFHEVIKLDDENQILRDKRNIILNKLESNICNEAPSFEKFDQGSYAMGTGIQPVNGDYDIDVGLRFKISKDGLDPIKAKSWVYNALKGHTNNVEMKTPCVTVTYSLKGEPAYHVDLTVYAADNLDGKLYLAKGRRNSKEEYRIWESSNPLKLTKLFNEHYSDLDERAQFKRVIRYMKRWKDLHMPQKGFGKVTGIALTVAAWKYMKPRYDHFLLIFPTELSDIKTLMYFVEHLLDAFQDGRLELRIPSVEDDLDDLGVDLVKEMTYKQMEYFQNKLKDLLENLKVANDEGELANACELLRKSFGEDFPIP